MASVVLRMVVENSSLLNSPTSLKSKVGDALGQFSKPPKVEGKLTLINCTLWELTERINPFFSTRKLEWTGAGESGYDFIGLPFQSFEVLNAHLRKYYGNYFR